MLLSVSRCGESAAKEVGKKALEVGKNAVLKRYLSSRACERSGSWSEAGQKDEIGVNLRLLGGVA